MTGADPHETSQLVGEAARFAAYKIETRGARALTDVERRFMYAMLDIMRDRVVFLDLMISEMESRIKDEQRNSQRGGEREMVEPNETPENETPKQDGEGTEPEKTEPINTEDDDANTQPEQ